MEQKEREMMIKHWIIYCVVVVILKIAGILLERYANWQFEELSFIMGIAFGVNGGIYFCYTWERSK